MFDFEKLEVYKVIEEINIKLFNFLESDKKIEFNISDQWKRATLSILLNLAEGTGRITNPDKKNFITIARSSIFEATAILNLIYKLKLIDENSYNEFYNLYEQSSKMLLGMYRSYN